VMDARTYVASQDEIHFAICVVWIFNFKLDMFALVYLGV
jgi:hypothetical protein